ncbi:MAG: ROK family protein [Anaerolineae bacterium]|nr:ROK family protein [Anaerolineae bacterium]
MGIYIAVDIGGTQMRAAAFPSQGNIPLQIKRISTHAVGHSPIDRLITLIKDIMPPEEEIIAIGVAAPGPLDQKKGVILDTPNIPELHDFPIIDYLSRHFKKPAVLDNDANLAALSEWKIGSGKGHLHLIYLTISTGIGSGIIIDGRLLHGQLGLAPELGHTTILPNGPRCGCGQYGHLESVASGPAIASWVQKSLLDGVESSISKSSPLTASIVAQAAAQGDQLGQAAFTRAGTFIGQALADFIHIFNPSVVIFGGGVSRSGNLLISPVKNALKKYILSPSYLENLTITTAALGDDAGLIGAQLLAKQLTH